MFTLLILSLFGCPTAEPEAEACPTSGYTENADLPCLCGGELVESLPECGYAECTEEGMVYLDIGCDTGGGCKGLDCG